MASKTRALADNVSQATEARIYFVAIFQLPRRVPANETRAEPQNTKIGRVTFFVQADCPHKGTRSEHDTAVKLPGTHALDDGPQREHQRNRIAPNLYLAVPWGQVSKTLLPLSPPSHHQKQLRASLRNLIVTHTKLLAKFLPYCCMLYIARNTPEICRATEFIADAPVIARLL